MPSQSKKPLLPALVTAGIIAIGAACFFYFTHRAETTVAAPGGGSEECSSFTAHLPQKIMGEERKRATGAGTAVWGDGDISLRCGVRPPDPTVNLCMTVDGIDWVLDEQKAKNSGSRILTTYGRNPAIEVTIKNSSSGDVLVDFDRAVKKIPQGEHKCVGIDDVG